MTIRVQKGVPIPPVKPRGRNGGLKYRRKYPWHEMEIGDSFNFPNPGESGKNAHNAVILASKNGRRFVARQYDGGYRVWRVE